MESIYADRTQSVLGLLDEDSEIFIVQLVGQVKRLQYRKVFEQILAKSKKYPFQKILLNYHDLENNPDFGRRWFTTYFMRRFYKITQGLQLAVVSPKNPLERTSIALFYSLIKTLGIQVKVRFFENIAQARQWLEDTKIDGRGEDDFDSEGGERVREVTLDKQKRLKLRVRFDPKGKLEKEESSMSLPSFPSLKTARDFFKFKK
jgi:hypothetical protein